MEERTHLGSTIQGNGDCDREVKNGVQAGWNRGGGGGEIMGILYDRRARVSYQGRL